MTKRASSLKTRQREYHGAARSMTERAPWLFEHDDRAVVCKDSGLLYSWEYRGRDPSDASTHDFNHAADRAQRAFLQLRDRPSVLWFTVRRRRAYDYPSMRQPDAITQQIDDRRAAAFRAGRAYTNRYYMSALMLPSTGSAAFFERLRYFTLEEEMSPVRAAWYATRSLFAARDAFAYSAAQLDAQAARQMKLLDEMLTGIPDVKFQPLRGEHRLAFLQNSYPRSGREVAAVASPGESWLLDAYLPDQHFYTGSNFGIFEGDHQHHVAAYAIKTDGYPRGKKEGGTGPGMLSPLLAIDGEITISQCFVVSSVDEQRTHMKATVSLDPELRAASGMSFAPVAALLERSEHRHWLADWIRILIEMHGYEVKSEDVTAIWVALDITAALPDRSLWTLSTVTTHLPPHLKVHLRPWIQGGQYGHFFDNPVDAFNLGTLTCIELADVLKERQLAVPFLLYIFMRVDDRLAFRADTREREPTIIYIEESSFLLQEDYIAPHIRGWAATLAKRLATLGLTTQSPEDYADSAVFAAIRDNFPTQIHLANTKATENKKIHEVLSGQFGLSDAIIDVIVQATPKKEYIVVQPDVSVKISLDFDKETLACLRSDQLAQSIFDRHYQRGRGRPGWQDDYIADLLAAEAAGFTDNGKSTLEENTL
ncbi:VirB4 family type IV secretion system protein [Burkholderia glumae]|uniref:VirB4 family type IV secretion system protein n=1 Tax=Burkholderia glumae TaxID=337 RepID=UPI0020374D8A|nr:hypothetical protein [Burkholderia glumae]MCM2552657.1 hypothetical protein [Burkholderia glumae]